MVNAFPYNADEIGWIVVEKLWSGLGGNDYVLA